MRRTILWIVVVIVVVAFVARRTSLRSSLPHDGLSRAVQRPLAPEFTLPQLNGQQVSLSSYRGRIVLLDFWATWCVPCREETPHFVELQQKYGERGLQVIGVSMDDSPAPVRPFVEQFHVNYPIVMGSDDISTKFGGLLGMPTSYLINRDGKIVKRYIGSLNEAQIVKDVESQL